MSIIYDAVNKAAGDQPIVVNSFALDTYKLFPVPAAAQQAELANVAGRLLEYRRRDTGLVIGIGSCAPREGASYISYNIARTLALGMGKRVLWVDANHLAPQPSLRVTEHQTFADLLAGPTDLPGNIGLAVLPGGLDLPVRKADYAGPALAQCVERFRETYDFTFIDCPPMLEAVDTALLGAAADGFVLVVEANRLKHHVVNRSLDELNAYRVNVLGTVLNKRRFELPGFIYRWL